MLALHELINVTKHKLTFNCKTIIKEKGFSQKIVKVAKELKNDLILYYCFRKTRVNRKALV
jgi:hypothetical protein